MSHVHNCGLPRQCVWVYIRVLTSVNCVFVYGRSQCPGRKLENILIYHYSFTMCALPAFRGNFVGTMISCPHYMMNYANTNTVCQCLRSNVTIYETTVSFILYYSMHSTRHIWLFQYLHCSKNGGYWVVFEVSAVVIGWSSRYLPVWTHRVL